MFNERMDLFVLAFICLSVTRFFLRHDTQLKTYSGTKRQGDREWVNELNRIDFTIKSFHIIELNFIRILQRNDRYLCELKWIKICICIKSLLTMVNDAN